MLSAPGQLHGSWIRTRQPQSSCSQVSSVPVAYVFVIAYVPSRTEMLQEELPSSPDAEYWGGVSEPGRHGHAWIYRRQGCGPQAAPPHRRPGQGTAADGRRGLLLRRRPHADLGGEPG